MKTMVRLSQNFIFASKHSFVWDSQTLLAKIAQYGLEIIFNFTACSVSVVICMTENTLLSIGTYFATNGLKMFHS